MNPSDEFDALGNDAGLWMVYGDSLYRSASTIKSSTNLLRFFRKRVYGMLLGYTVEVYLKTLWLIKGNQIATNGRLVRFPGAKTHRLLTLAQTVGIELSEQDAGVLDRLSDFVRFAGRYPVPTESADMEMKPHPRGGLIRPGYFRAKDWEVAEAVALRLQNEIHRWAARTR